ncbi:hypothetical protein L7F22_002676 [Adiantum nelumboides]|nr:hypothetical protein [Adiantum nelumboides]
MGDIAVEACRLLPTYHPHYSQEVQKNSVVHPQSCSLPLPKSFLEYLERSGIPPSIYSIAQTLPRYIRIKPGFEDKIPSLEVELGCKLSPLMWLQGFYSLPHDAPIASSEAYRVGKIYGMDAASGAAVSALGVIEGDHVLDLCAAPDQLGNSGTLTGVDIARHRLAACRTMLLKYGLGKSCRLFVADGASFTLLPLHQGVGSIEGESSANNAVDGALKEWSSRKTRKEKKREAKLQREKGKADLLFYGNGSGVVGLTKGQLFENCCMIGRNCSENGYDKVRAFIFV